MEEEEENNNNNLNVYRFRGRDGETVPIDVQKVIVDKSLEVLPEAFCGPDPNPSMDDPFRIYHRLQEVVLHEQLKSIGVDAFSWSTLRQIKIFATTERIGQKAFNYCESLEKVEFIPAPSSSSSSSRGSLKWIGESAFNYCDLLTQISIPSSVASIGFAAFRETGLVEVDLSRLSLLRTVQRQVFMNCANLQAVRLSNSVHTICSNAFYGCASLVTVEMPHFEAALHTIERKAFSGCKSLMNINLQYINYDVDETVFDECTLLHERFAKMELDAHDVNVLFRTCRGLSDQSIDELALHRRICRGLFNRFKTHPVHKMCYHASTTTTEAFSQAIQQQEQSKMLFDLDEFNMTPFHVLCSSVSPRRDMLEALLATYPSHILGWKDANDKRAMDYLIKNWAPELLEMMFESWVVSPMRRWGTACRIADMTSQLQDLQDTRFEAMRRKHYTAICKTFETYERLESISLLEMALWKKEISDGRNADRTKKVALDREQCLNQCGSSVALPSVVAFLEMELVASQGDRIWKSTASHSCSSRVVSSNH